MKSGFRGSGGKRAFWATIAILMQQERVAGDVGRSPQEGDWLELCARATGKMMKVITLQDMKKAQGSQPVKTKMHLYLDLGAATQSGRGSAEGAGLVYIGIDLREWVYSYHTGTWVQTLVLDYMKREPGEIWDMAERMVREVTGWKGEIVRSMLWCSPNCHTYSIADAIKRLWLLKALAEEHRQEMEDTDALLDEIFEDEQEYELRLACIGRRVKAWPMQRNDEVAETISTH